MSSNHSLMDLERWQLTPEEIKEVGSEYYSVDMQLMEDPQVQALRTTSIGASELGEAIGIQPFSPASALVDKKRGILKRDMPAHRSRSGRYAEDFVIQMAVEDLRDAYQSVEPVEWTVWLRHKDYPFLSASPDGILQINGDLWNHQIKTSSQPPSKKKGWGTNMSGDVPGYIKVQVQQEYECLRSHGYDVKGSIVSCEFAYMELRSYVVLPATDSFHVYANRAKEVWQHVVDDKPYPLDHSHPKANEYISDTYKKVTGEVFEAPELREVHDKYVEEQRKVKELAASCDTARAKILDAMGDAFEMHIPGRGTYKRLLVEPSGKRKPYVKLSFTKE